MRRVRDALITGQLNVDRAYLETYRHTGLLIDAHLLLFKERADYGAQVIPRLARALGVGERLLYRCLRFVREYPILSGRTELGWTHYRVLMEVQDKAQRKALESEARKKRWKAEELERRVRMLNAINATPAKTEGGTESASAPKPLTPKRGTVGMCRLVADGEALAIANDMPEVKGFSERNIKRMLAFAREYPALRRIVPQPVALLPDAGANQIVPQAVAQLPSSEIVQTPSAKLAVPGALTKVQQLVAQIPWGQNVILLDKDEDLSARLWYVQQTITHGWSRSITEDLPRRWKQHVAGTAAEWTRKHRPKQVFYWEECYLFRAD